MIDGQKVAEASVGREAGFTLVEVLVALALFSLLATLLFNNVRFGLKAWQTGSFQGELLERSAAAQDALRRLIGNAYPMLMAGGGSDPSIDFEGAQETITFLGDAPVVTGGAGRFRFKLFPERNQDQTDLIIASTPELANPQDSSMTTRSVLAADIDRVEFSYSQGRTNLPTQWSNSWSQRGALPMLVRVRVAFRSGDARLWPDLLIAPRIAADVSCAYDPISKRCRGR
jgi:general secretion pathway protein J